MEDLNDDCLKEIFGHLDFINQYNLSKINPRFYFIIQSDNKKIEVDFSELPRATPDILTTNHIYQIMHLFSNRVNKISLYTGFFENCGTEESTKEINLLYALFSFKYRFLEELFLDDFALNYTLEKSLNLNFTSLRKIKIRGILPYPVNEETLLSLLNGCINVTSISLQEHLISGFCLTKIKKNNLTELKLKNVYFTSQQFIFETLENQSNLFRFDYSRSDIVVPDSLINLPFSTIITEKVLNTAVNLKTLNICISEENQLSDMNVDYENLKLEDVKLVINGIQNIHLSIAIFRNCKNLKKFRFQEIQNKFLSHSIHTRHHWQIIFELREFVGLQTIEIAINNLDTEILLFLLNKFRKTDTKIIYGQFQNYEMEYYNIHLSKRSKK